MGALPLAKFGVTYQVNASLVGAQALGSIVPTWSATGALGTLTPNAAGTTITAPVPPNAIGGNNFQLTISVTLTGSPPITITETQTVHLIP